MLPSSLAEATSTSFLERGQPLAESDEQPVASAAPRVVLA